jgi:hypothetical protein
MIKSLAGDGGEGWESGRVGEWVGKTPIPNPEPPNPFIKVFPLLQVLTVKYQIVGAWLGRLFDVAIAVMNDSW